MSRKRQLEIEQELADQADQAAADHEDELTGEVAQVEPADLDPESEVKHPGLTAYEEPTPHHHRSAVGSEPHEAQPHYADPRPRESIAVDPSLDPDWVPPGDPEIQVVEESHDS